MIKKVISGGQIGADIAGLRAAKSLGIETGGTAPSGWATLRGPNSNLGTEYGLVECVKPGYPARTKENVVNSDCTICLAINFNSYGELATAREIRRAHKPHYDVIIRDTYWTPLPWHIAIWIDRHDYKIINIAGNAIEDLEEPMEHYLRELFILTNGGEYVR